MNNSLTVYMKVEEVCHAAGISDEVLIEIVEHGIVDSVSEAPLATATKSSGYGAKQSSSRTPTGWLFDPQIVPVVKRASRLKYDLDIDWPGVALAMDLLTELEGLRIENQRLRQRLKRFVRD